MGCNYCHTITGITIFVCGLAVAFLHILYASEVRAVWASNGPATNGIIVDKGKLYSNKLDCPINPEQLDTVYCKQHYTLYFEVKGKNYSQQIHMNEEEFLYNRKNPGDPCVAYGYEDDIYVVQKKENESGLMLFGIIICYCFIGTSIVFFVLFCFADTNVRSKYNPIA